MTVLMTQALAWILFLQVLTELSSYCHYCHHFYCQYCCQLGATAAVSTVILRGASLSDVCRHAVSHSPHECSTTVPPVSPHSSHNFCWQFTSQPTALAKTVSCRRCRYRLRWCFCYGGQGQTLTSIYSGGAECTELYPHSFRTFVARCHWQLCQ